MILYCDGFTEYSNPSRTGGGWVVFSEDETILEIGCIKKSGFTSNEAELLGIQKALQIAQQNDEVRTDSMNNLAWIKSCKSKVRADLMPIMKECNELQKNKNIKLTFVPRDKNLAGVFIEYKLGINWEKKFK